MGEYLSNYRTTVSRARGRTGGREGVREGSGGSRQSWEVIPTLATAPEPQNPTGSVAGAPGGWITGGEGRRRGIPRGNGGIDGFRYFPTIATPAGRPRRDCAR